MEIKNPDWLEKMITSTEGRTYDSEEDLLFRAVTNGTVFRVGDELRRRTYIVGKVIKDGPATLIDGGRYPLRLDGIPPELWGKRIRIIIEEE